MNIEEIREYCIAKNGVEESFPFGEEHLVFKVGGKIFGILAIDDDKSLNLKCDPELAIEYREKYNFVLPGYHMNKKHWNTIQNLETIDNNLISKMIDHSYDLIIKSLSKNEQKKYQ